MENNDLSLCFIIACKVYKNYQSYLHFYISNIKKYYNNVKIILVDNNSEYQDIYKSLLIEFPDLIFLQNLSNAKFELGAYKFATEFIKKNDLKFDYYICVQDTFVLVNKYNFNILKEKNVSACSLAHFHFFRSFNLHTQVLSQLNLYDNREEFLCCWCNSWVCNHDILIKINELLKNVNPITRGESAQTERYMGKILKMFNNNISFAIEEGFEGNNYNCHTIDPTTEHSKSLGHYFIKRAQQKNENTR